MANLGPKVGARIDDLAAHILATNRGIGMTPPFYAETASVKGDPNWPFWIVRNKSCNSLGGFASRSHCEALAEAMNRQSGYTT